jgi:uncharacterized membrane protein (DUF441 family)
MKILYALLCVLGTLLPLAQFAPWLMEHGLNFGLLLQQAFATQVAGFAWLDVLVSALVFLVFSVAEAKRISMRNWWVSWLGLCVGVSLALPLFLLLRQIHLDAQKY